MEVARTACLPKPRRRQVPAGFDEARRIVCYNNAPSPTGPNLALFCSVKCPGKLIMDTYDLAQHLRDIGVTVISGFHSPMEQECLHILLRSPNPVIWCLARGLLAPVACAGTVLHNIPLAHRGKVGVAYRG